MLTMDKIQDISFRHFMKGENISQIADKLHLDWKTTPAKQKSKGEIHLMN